MKQSQTIPLSQAYLCCTCETVGDDASRCPVCGSTFALLSLARVFEGRTKRGHVTFVRTGRPAVQGTQDH